MSKFLKKSVISIIFSLLILFGVAGQSYATEKMTLIQGWNTWEPFTYMDNHNKLNGLDIEVAHHIFSRAGYDVKYQEAPWPRQLLWIEDGTIHITASSMKTPEREVHAYFSDPYYKESYIVYVRKGEAANYRFASLSDIIGSSFRLGVMRGSLYGPEFQRLMNDPAFSEHIEEVTTDKQNHTKLLSHRIDGFIQESSRMSVEESKTGIFAQVEPLFVIEENLLHFMFSKKATTPEIVNVFNIGLKIMRADGTYQKIFKKYKLDQFNMLKDLP
ncbi:MAG: amino acid ABC transporter substrate-binding protein [Desulfobulbaceae bacterium]|nr:MAG: amino acid ABC transporter substrate-binding protein [Desulfobulbaceae bacterium]